MATKKAKAKRERRERRFQPRSTTSPAAVRAAAGLGAMALGAGVWAQVGRELVLRAPSGGEPLGPLPFAPWILAGGAVLVGVAIWFGTSGDVVLRVGDAGLAVEKGSAVRRMPWHRVESVTFDGAAHAVVVGGADEASTELSVKIPVASQPQAAAWLLKEARARVAAVVDVDDEAIVGLPPAREDGGESIAIDPLQVVGKRCAASGETIAYEPDARVCPRCERVYHRTKVPDECECGASLTHLQTKAKEASEASA